MTTNPQVSRQGIVKVNWEGSLLVHHSLGMVNRELLLRLIERSGLSLRHVPFEPDQFDTGSGDRLASLNAIRQEPFSDAAVHVRHRWPPDFSAPHSGAYVFFQPWEYGSLPVEWVRRIPLCAREVWVYSRYLKECYVASGLHESVVHVIPLGVDENEFRPDAKPSAWLRTMAGNRYRFFYNGGITLRKGVDILVNAFLNEFGKDENVCLIIKGSNAYKKDLAARVAELAGRTDIARIVYLTDDIPPRELPSLYTACDCYVHPYRAEGFGLPVAEAMACGRPVIVTGAGACRDYAGEDDSYLIKCSMEKFRENSVSGIETVGSPFWLIPDHGDLRRLMRHVFEHQEEAKSRGLRASGKIRTRHTWKQSADAVEERIKEIAECGFRIAD